MLSTFYTSDHSHVEGKERGNKTIGLFWGEWYCHGLYNSNIAYAISLRPRAHMNGRQPSTNAGYEDSKSSPFRGIRYIARSAEVGCVRLVTTLFSMSRPQAASVLCRGSQSTAHLRLDPIIVPYRTVDALRLPFLQSARMFLELLEPR